MAERIIEKVGITGAEGLIGGVLMQNLPDLYDVHAFTLYTAPFPSNVTSTVVDLSDKAQVKGAFEGIDAVIHLAADKSPFAGWESIWRNNYVATKNVFDECLAAGVKRIIFASSNHVQHADMMGESAEILKPGPHPLRRVSDPTKPDSYYAASKLFGEELGYLYSHRDGLEFVGLRIGWVHEKDDPTAEKGTNSESYMRAVFLSHRDLIQIVQRGLEMDLRDTRFVLAYAVSDNARGIYDLTETRKKLGFNPLDNAERYFVSAKDKLSTNLDRAGIFDAHLQGLVAEWVDRAAK